MRAVVTGSSGQVALSLRERAVVTGKQVVQRAAWDSNSFGANFLRRIFALILPRCPVRVAAARTGNPGCALDIKRDAKG